jgi:hypothetical protein
MNAACKAVTSLILFIFITVYANAQAKNAIGLGPAFSTSEDNPTGFGIVFQGEIKLDKSFSIVPSVGVEVPYVVYAGLAGRYYVEPRFYLHVGGFFRAGGDTFSESGPGGTAGLGYMVLSTKRNVIDLNFHGDIMNAENRSRAVGGIRIIYSFSFTHLDK